MKICKECGKRYGADIVARRLQEEFLDVRVTWQEELVLVTSEDVARRKQVLARGHQFAGELEPYCYVCWCAAKK